MNNFNFLETTKIIEEKYTQIEFFKDKNNFREFGDYWFVEFLSTYTSNNVVRQIIDKHLLEKTNIDFFSLASKSFFQSLDKDLIDRLYTIFVTNYQFLTNITEEEFNIANLDDDEIVKKANAMHRIFFEAHYSKDMTKKDEENFNKKYSSKSLRRKYRKLQRRLVVQLSSIFGLVNKQVKYCSNKTLELFNQQRLRNKNYIENTILSSRESDKVLNLKDIVRTPEQEFAEKLAIMNCYEKMAEEDNYTWSFITMTLDGEYHPNPTKGSNHWNGVPVYESVEILQKKWARIRTNLHDNQIRVYGVKVAEVHQDGCFHLHALVFHDAENFNKITKIVKNHFNSNENQAKIELNNGNASASSYCFKYIQKTLSSDVAEKSTIDKDYYTTMKNQAMRQACSVRALSFFGLKKGLITKWRTFARNYKREKSLSDNVILSNIITTNDLYSFQKLADSISLETEIVKTSTGTIYKKILGFTFDGIKVLKELFTLKKKPEKDDFHVDFSSHNSTIKKNYPRKPFGPSQYLKYFKRKATEKLKFMGFIEILT
ncbi:replication endonuclease [Vogesella sp. DC21W]|uniref:Replication endonuclease n=1 Tax=Vogesella aquatica TaxID=2984206 RepID=A0ABT5IU61_9NEIS|nr:replication endonuclease [Vogesella aquatica]MDC7716110.1 replication endonuclease [Vogesella aquatica]